MAETEVCKRSEEFPRLKIAQLCIALTIKETSFKWTDSLRKRL